jgi:hypothetical protein
MTLIIIKKNCCGCIRFFKEIKKIFNQIYFMEGNKYDYFG